MSGIGSSTANVTVTRSKRRMDFDGINWFRQDIALTLTGHSPSTPENLVLVGYRGATLVMASPSFAGTSSSATGTISTNTTELQTKIADMQIGGVCTVAMRLWDQASLELIASGVLDILAPKYAYSTDTGATPVTPISGSTIIWGKLALYNGITYRKNDDDGLWYPTSLRGTGDQMHDELDETGGIVIPT